MKVLTLSSGQTKQEVLQIEQPMSGFLIQQNVAGTVSIEIVRTTAQGSKTILPLTNIERLQAVSEIMGIRMADTHNDESNVYWFVPVTMTQDALSMDNGYLTLRVEKDSLVTGAVFGMETFGRTSFPMLYEHIHTNANIQKELQTAGAKMALIPQDSTIELISSSGESTTLTGPELRFIGMAESTPKSFTADQNHDTVCIVLDDIHRVKITTTQNNFVTLIK